MSLAFTRYKTKIRVVLQMNVSCLNNINDLQKSDCFLKKSLALNEFLKIEKDIDESPNYKKNKSSLESEVSWWYGTKRKTIITTSNDEIELVAAILTLRILLYIYWRILLLVNLCATYTRLYFLTVTVQKWYLNMQDYLLLSNNCSEITHGISHDHDV